MRIPPIVAVEIGTSRIVVCIGEAIDERHIKILGIGTYPMTTSSVRKGQIYDVSMVSSSLEMAARQAEKKSGISIGQVVLVVSGGHIKSQPYSGMLPLRASGTVVTREHMDEVRDLAQDIPLESDRRLLHTIEQKFSVDGREGIDNPEGLSCSRLSFNVLGVHGLRQRIDDAENAVKRARFDVADVAFSGVCTTLAVLKEEQKREGALLIDLGSGTTDFVVYHNRSVVETGSFAVGGDHITNDIALAFGLLQTEAEGIKLTEGSALIDAESANKRLTFRNELFEDRNISCHALQTVVHARMDEIFGMVRTHLGELGVLPHLSGSVVLTGGGAYMRQAPALAKKVFGLPCSIGTPVNVDGLEEQQPAALATAVGAVMLGVRTYESSSVGSWFGRLFRRRS